MFNKHYDSNKLYNFVSANYAVFQITLKISHFLHTHNFPKKKIELCIHQTYSKNLHNFVRLKYAMFQKMLKITHIQRTHLKKKSCALNIHCLLLKEIT